MFAKFQPTVKSSVIVTTLDDLAIQVRSFQETGLTIGVMLFNTHIKIATMSCSGEDMDSGAFEHYAAVECVIDKLQDSYAKQYIVMPHRFWFDDNQDPTEIFNKIFTWLEEMSNDIA